MNAEPKSAAPAIARLHGVTAVHIGQHMSDGSTVETAETRLRLADSASAFSFVVLVEGIGVHQLEAAMPDVVQYCTCSFVGVV